MAFLLDRLASKDGNARQPFSPEAAKDGVILKRIEQFGDRFGGFFRLRRAEGFRVVSQGLQANLAIGLHVARVEESDLGHWLGRWNQLGLGATAAGDHLGLDKAAGITIARPMFRPEPVTRAVR